jgi:hypothetical protein
VIAAAVERHALRANRFLCRKQPKSVDWAFFVLRMHGLVVAERDSLNCVPLGIRPASHNAARGSGSRAAVSQWTPRGYRFDFLWFSAL